MNFNDFTPQSIGDCFYSIILSHFTGDFIELRCYEKITKILLKKKGFLFSFFFFLLFVTPDEFFLSLFGRMVANVLIFQGKVEYRSVVL